MTQIHIEYTDNVQFPANQGLFLQGFNRCLAEVETFKLTNIKTRLIKLTTYCSGDGEVAGFVYLRLAIYPGRADELKQLACDR
jgi:5-carboxymethyl-2-hydroxymuconate isomerase